MSNSSDAIGIFDSGVGGLTVMHELAQLLPNEHLIYFGDTARAPYGSKSPETIMRYAIEIVHFFLQHPIKLLVVACNTLCAYTLSHLATLCAIPLIGVIDAGIEKALVSTKNHHVGILATQATIQSAIFQKTFSILSPTTQTYSVACPLFVPLIEENWLDHAATRLIIREYLSQLPLQKIDTLLLGCTHFPLLKESIQQEAGPHITLVDSASICALQIASYLKNADLICSTQQRRHAYFTSAHPERFTLMAEKLFGYPLDDVKQVHLAEIK